MPLVSQAFLFDTSDNSVHVADEVLQFHYVLSFGNGSSTAMNSSNRSETKRKEHICLVSGVYILVRNT